MPTTAHSFTIEVDHGRVHARARRAAGDAPPDTAAADMVARMVALAGEPADTARLAILDLREAPLIADPDTMHAMVELLAAWEAAGRKIALVVGDEAIRATQYRAAAARHAPKFARVVADPSEALAWCDA